MSWFDRLPPAVRHALVGLLAAVIAYATNEYMHWGLDPALYPIIGAALGVAVLWITPLSRQYGIGSKTLEAPTGGPQDEVNA